MNIYLAGPMRGYDRLNFPAFDRAAAELRAQGHTVFSPADNDREKGYDTMTGQDIRRACIFDDLEYIIKSADAVALLPGWEASKGVAAEVATAKFLDLEIIELAA